MRLLCHTSYRYRKYRRLMFCGDGRCMHELDRSLCPGLLCCDACYLSLSGPTESSLIMVCFEIIMENTYGDSFSILTIWILTQLYRNFAGWRCFVKWFWSEVFLPIPNHDKITDTTQPSLNLYLYSSTQSPHHTHIHTTIIPVTHLWFSFCPYSSFSLFRVKL